MKSIPFLLILLHCLTAAAAQTPCGAGQSCFGPTERAMFDVVYSLGPVWVKTGTVVFEADLITSAGKELWHLKASGRTLPAYDWFFKVRDYYESWVEPAGFRPVRAGRNIYEDGNTLINSIRFLPGDSLAATTTKRNNGPVTSDTLRQGPCAFDMLSSVYYFRTLDIASFPINEKIPVKVIIDDSLFIIHVRYLGTEEIVMPSGERYRCLKCAARMVHGTVFREGEDVMVWVTDDRRKIPVYIEAKILVGTAKAYLKKI